MLSVSLFGFLGLQPERFLSLGLLISVVFRFFCWRHL